LIELALDEFWAVQKDFVAGLDGDTDVEHLLDLLYTRAGVYKTVIRAMQARIVQNTTPEVLSAIFDLATCFRAIEHLDESDMVKTAAYYDEAGQSGMVYALLVRSSMTTPGHSIDRAQLQRCRQALLTGWPNTIRHCRYQKSSSFLELESLGINLLENQIFMPEPLWHISSIRDDVLVDDRTDCLGRSVLGMTTDAGFRSLWVGQGVNKDRIHNDLVGRDQWYLSCCIDHFQ